MTPQGPERRIHFGVNLLLSILRLWSSLQRVCFDQNQSKVFSNFSHKKETRFRSVHTGLEFQQNTFRHRCRLLGCIQKIIDAYKNLLWVASLKSTLIRTTEAHAAESFEESQKASHAMRKQHDPLLITRYPLLPWPSRRKDAEIEEAETHGTLEGAIIPKKSFAALQ